MNGLLLGGIIGEGMKSFVSSYNQTQDRMRQQAEADETRALRRRQIDLSEQSQKEKTSMSLREQKLKEAQEGLEYDDATQKFKSVGKPMWQKRLDYQDGLIRGRDSGRMGGKQLPSSDVLKVTEGERMPGLLADLEQDIKLNTNIMGPVKGLLGKYNPYNTQAQSFNSKMTTAAQQIGKYFEGGVLRAEDVPKYRAMLPQITDTPEVAEEKRLNVLRMLEQKQSGDVQGLIGAGYKAQSFQKPPTTTNREQKTRTPKYAPGTVLQINGKNFRVGQDGDTLDEIK